MDGRDARAGPAGPRARVAAEEGSGTAPETAGGGISGRPGATLDAAEAASETPETPGVRPRDRRVRSRTRATTARTTPREPASPPSGTPDARVGEPSQAR